MKLLTGWRNPPTNRAEDLEMKNAEIEETESNKSKQLTRIAEEEECVLNMV